MTSRYVPGYGPSTAKIAIVGEAPGALEDEQGKPLVGVTGREVDAFLRLAGSSLEACYRTNVFKYRPPDNKIKRASETGHTVEEGIPQLWNEIKAINPNVIIALGDLALETLTGKKGIKKWRGSILSTKLGISKVVPTIHPAALYHAEDKGALPYQTKYFIAHDIRRAVEESNSSKLNLPIRTLQICKSSLQLSEFLRINKSSPRVSVDIEAHKCIPSCIGIAFNSHHALSIPLFNYSGSSYTISDSDLSEMWMMIAEFLERPDLQIIGQNFKYDADKLSRPIGIECSPWLDTMLLAHCLYPEFPGRLEFLTSIFTREPYYKDEYKEFDIKRDSIDQIYLYNCKDAAVTYEIAEVLLKELESRNLSDYFFNYRMKLHDAYLSIDREGFAVDIALRDAALAEYEGKEVILDNRINELIGHEFNIRSNPQIAKVFTNELHLPRRSSYDEDSITSLLANHCKDSKTQEILTSTLLSRKIKRTKKLLQTRLDYDGRARTNYRIHAANSGRSGTGILKPPIRPEPIGYNFQNMTKHGEIGKFFRRQFIADPGWLILNADLSQAEPRIIAFLAKDEFTLDLFARGIDVHKVMAGWIFGLTDEEALLLPKESPEDPRRFMGKKTRNAIAYDMHKRRFMIDSLTEASKAGLKLNYTEKKFGEILELAHSKAPNIRGVFHAEVKACLDRDRTLINPYGWPRRSYDRPGDDTYRSMYSFIPQSTVRDKIGYALLNIIKENPEIRITCEAHDSLTFLVKPDELNDIAKLVKKSFEEPIDFERCSLKRKILIIPCSLEVGDNYRDLEDYYVT